MPVRFPLLPLLALTALLLGGCATLPPPGAVLNYSTHAAPIPPVERAAFNARVYDQAATWVARRYFDPTLAGTDWSAAETRHRPAALAATTDTELYTALNALLGELHDEHTHAISPREVDAFQRRRSVLLGFRTGPLPGGTKHRRILSVFPGSPAARAGVMPGWILVAADDRPPGEVLGLAKLDDGQLVRCDFLDSTGNPVRREIRARRLEYPPVRDASLLPGNVLLLAFDTFDLPAARWVRAELKRRRPAGVILDLRNNVGGEARALAAILAEFFPGRTDLGRIRSRTSTAPSARRTPRHSFGAKYRGPLAVLVSEASASAAEILAAVVQHERRGAIVGTTTSGNVLVCVRWPLPGGGQLQVSVYDYVGPDGQRLEHRGVTPDLVVEPAPGTEPDPQVEAAHATLFAPTEPRR